MPELLPTKPRFRGRLHQFAFFVTIPAGLVLVALVVAGAVLQPAEEADQAALQERDWPLADAPDGAGAAARIR